MIFSPSCKVLIVTLDPSGIETLHLLKMSIDEIFLKLKNEKKYKSNILIASVEKGSFED